MVKSNSKCKYGLYLASGITLWKTYFSKKYSPAFNKKISLFEPGTLDNPDDHRFIPIGIACQDLDEINHADAILAYMKNYKTLDGSPTGTDSTWECGYSVAKGKPVIAIIEDEEHIDYYAAQWMISFAINAVITTDKKVAEKLKDHPKYVHATILLAQDIEQFESLIIKYLDEYYRSIHSRSGIINYHVDEIARDMFSKDNLKSMVFTKTTQNREASKILEQLRGLDFKFDEDSLKVCEIERKISKQLQNIFVNSKTNEIENEIDMIISSVVQSWNSNEDHMLNCLEHSIEPPFKKVEGRKQGIKKTRPEIFFELYDLVTHHLIEKQKFIKKDKFPYEVGAIIELYNWMNTYALDDVFDNSEHRQKLETVWKRFSRNDAIHTGILGHLLTLKYFFLIASENKDIARKLAEIMNNYNYMMYEGQVLDLKLTFDSDKKKSILKNNKLEDILKLYIQRIYGICGGFYESIGELSAKAGNKGEQIFNAKEIDVVSPLVAMYYGLIQMIRNDLGDYIIVEDISRLSKGMKGVSHSDIEEGKTDIAYLLALYSKNISKEEEKFLIDCLNKKLSKKEKLKINEILWKTGSITLVVEFISYMIDYVKSTWLHRYQETPARMKWMFDLVEITDAILIPFRKQALDNKWISHECDPRALNLLTSEMLNLEKTPKGKRLSKLKDDN